MPVTASGAPRISGYILMNSGRYLEALQSFQQTEPKTAELWNQIGIAAEHLEMTVEAESSFRTAIQLQPHFADAYNNLGTVYAGQRQYGKAERRYKQALHLDGRNAYCELNLGSLYFARKKYRKGLEAYRRALAIDPEILTEHPENVIDTAGNIHNLRDLHFYLATLLAQAGKDEDALVYLRKAVGEGFHDRKLLLSNGAFAGLHADPQFKALLEELQS